MARLLNLTFRFLLQNPVKRTIMTAPSRCEKALEKLKDNSYYEKYAEKIAKLQQTSPEQFLSRVDNLEKTAPQQQQKKKSDGVVTEGKFSQLLNPKKALNETETSEAALDKIMKLDLIKDKSEEEIKEIWHKYHLEKNFIAAVIPREDYEALCVKSREFPVFLFPLPRTQGYEFVMCQFDKNCVHFTPLLYYQVHKENAPECLTITHYTELKADKNIVLMRGEYDKNVIDLKEAQCLANQLQLYYVRPSEEKQKLMETFNKKPDEFKHMDLIKQIESLSL